MAAALLFSTSCLSRFEIAETKAVYLYPEPGAAWEKAVEEAFNMDITSPSYLLPHVGFSEAGIGRV
jgi:hypothetical protein